MSGMKKKLDRDEVVIEWFLFFILIAEFWLWLSCVFEGVDSPSFLYLTSVLALGLLCADKVLSWDMHEYRFRRFMKRRRALISVSIMNFIISMYVLISTIGPQQINRVKYHDVKRHSVDMDVVGPIVDNVLLILIGVALVFFLYASIRSMSMLVLRCFDQSKLFVSHQAEYGTSKYSKHYQIQLDRTKSEIIKSWHVAFILGVSVAFFLYLTSYVVTSLVTNSLGLHHLVVSNLIWLLVAIFMIFWTAPRLRVD